MGLTQRILLIYQEEIFVNSYVVTVFFLNIFSIIYKRAFFQKEFICIYDFVILDEQTVEKIKKKIGRKRVFPLYWYLLI